MWSFAFVHCGDGQCLPPCLASLLSHPEPIFSPVSPGNALVHASGLSRVLGLGTC